MNTADQGIGRDEALIRVVGAVVAAVIALVIMVVGAWLVRDGWMLGVAGLPGTTVLAWILAPRAAAAGTGTAIRAACELAVLSVVVADAWISVFLTAFAENEVLWVVWILLVGAIVFAPIATIVVVPAALAWVAILRRIAGPIP